MKNKIIIKIALALILVGVLLAASYYYNNGNTELSPSSGNKILKIDVTDFVSGNPVRWVNVYVFKLNDDGDGKTVKDIVATQLIIKENGQAVFDQSLFVTGTRYWVGVYAYSSKGFATIKELGYESPVPIQVKFVKPAEVLEIIEPPPIRLEKAKGNLFIRAQFNTNLIGSYWVSERFVDGKRGFVLKVRQVMVEKGSNPNDPDLFYDYTPFVSDELSATFGHAGYALISKDSYDIPYKINPGIFSSYDAGTDKLDGSYGIPMRDPFGRKAVYELKIGPAGVGFDDKTSKKFLPFESIKPLYTGDEYYEKPGLIKKDLDSHPSRTGPNKKLLFYPWEFDAGLKYSVIILETGEPAK